MTVSDLSPDALARLEAKLISDLEMVRKVRALLEEHQSALGTVSAPIPPVETPTAAASPLNRAAVPAVPKRSEQEFFMDCLLATEGRPFAPQDFKDALQRMQRYTPEDKSVKTFFNQMIRQGKLVVHQFRKGRPGSLYRSLILPPDLPKNPPAVPAESPEMAETVSQTSPQS